MNEGAVTLSPEGTILYCNQRFAGLLKTPLEQVIGSSALTVRRTNSATASAKGRL